METTTRVVTLGQFFSMRKMDTEVAVLWPIERELPGSLLQKYFLQS